MIPEYTKTCNTAIFRFFGAYPGGQGTFLEH